MACLKELASCLVSPVFQEKALQLLAKPAYVFARPAASAEQCASSASEMQHSCNDLAAWQSSSKGQAHEHSTRLPHGAGSAQIKTYMQQADIQQVPYTKGLVCIYAVGPIAVPGQTHANAMRRNADKRHERG